MKSKVCHIPEEIKQHVINQQFWQCIVGITLMTGCAKQPSVQDQKLASLLRLGGKEKSVAESPAL